MDVNMDSCRAIAIQYGLPLQFVIKEFHIFDVLAQITKYIHQKDIHLLFKGGTALSKVYLGKAQRFSEDIDFDLDEDMLAVKQFSKELSENIEGYDVLSSRKVRQTVQFYCDYENQLGGKDHVRIDIASKRVFTSSLPQLGTATSEFVKSSVSGFYVYNIEDLISRKIHALCTRTEGKDVYDVYNGISLCKNMEKPLQQMLKSEGKKETPKEFLLKTIDAIKKTDHKKLRNLTNPFIPLGYRPKDWLGIKNDLILKLEKVILQL